MGWASPGGTHVPIVEIIFLVLHVHIVALTSCYFSIKTGKIFSYGLKGGVLKQKIGGVNLGNISVSSKLLHFSVPVELNTRASEGVGGGGLNEMRRGG